jgi:hypothetical protein
LSSPLGPRVDLITSANLIAAETLLARDEVSAPSESRFNSAWDEFDSAEDL